jgi:ABC-type uncharacterized transport system substrate-binding protein
VRRRQFIAILSGAATWPLVALAQQRLPIVGIVGSTPSSEQRRNDAFIKRLSELGWNNGQTIAIEFRWSEGRNERVKEIAEEFVRLKVDIIIATGAGPVSAVRQVTKVIPIVFPIATDPVGTGLVATLSRPGGSTTGLSYMGTDLAAKRLQLLRGVAAEFSRVAIMANNGAAGAMLEMHKTLATASTLGIEAISLEIEKGEEIAPAIAVLKDRADALYVCADPLINSNRTSIVTAALNARLPTVFGERENADAGGLLSYGPNVSDMYRRAAEMVDKILRGTKPSEIPIEQPTKFEFVLNLKTAKALGLNVPFHLQQLADEIIE